MTIPRDDIAGLIERLQKWNDEWPHWEFTERQHDVMRLVLDYSAEAATQLAALSARVKELEGVIEHLNWGIECIRLEKADHDQQYVDMEARATRLQQERDEAYERLKTLANAEALAGVRKLVAGWNGEDRPDGPFKERHPDRLGATLPKTNCGAIYELDAAMTAASDLVRRLASGPEKEKKE